MNFLKQNVEQAVLVRLAQSEGITMNKEVYVIERTNGEGDTYFQWYCQSFDEAMSRFDRLKEYTGICETLSIIKYPIVNGQKDEHQRETVIVKKGRL